MRPLTYTDVYTKLTCRPRARFLSDQPVWNPNSVSFSRCGFCKRIAPVYYDLAFKFLESPDVKIAKVDCTMNINKELCAQEKVGLN